VGAFRVTVEPEWKHLKVPAIWYKEIDFVEILWLKGPQILVTQEVS
jgi:hypothetical protein